MKPSEHTFLGLINDTMPRETNVQDRSELRSDVVAVRGETSHSSPAGGEKNAEFKLSSVSESESSSCLYKFEPRYTPCSAWTVRGHWICLTY
jgi:hypothetical protein